MPTTALDILEQALLEVAKPGYPARTDRALSIFDEARMSLSPPAGRTSQRHDELVAACRSAQFELAKTVSPGCKDEDEGYKLLASLAHIQQEKHKRLLEGTIARLQEASLAPPIS